MTAGNGKLPANGAKGNIFAEPPGVSLSIPGPWANRKALVAAIEAASGGGMRVTPTELIDTVTGATALFEVFDRDEGIVQAMLRGAAGAIDPATEAQLTEHNLVVGITVPQVDDGLGGRLQRFTGVLREAGGHAVMVDKSGVAHPWSRWTEGVGADTLVDLYPLLMLQVGDEGLVATFGMKQFGLPDAAMNRNAQPDDAAISVLAHFNAFQIEQRPELNDGDVFVFGESEDEYEVTRQEDGRYSADHFYFNPFGVWRLERLPDEDLETS